MKKFISLGIISVLCLFLFGCSESDKRPISKNEFLMDTICTITLYEGDAEVIDDAFDYVRSYEKLLSRTVEDSDISKINENSGKEPVKVDPDTAEVIKKGIHYGDITHGKFDITIEPISSLWNFGQKDARVPEQSEIDERLPLINYRDITVNDDNTVMLNYEGQGIDLGAIAKGFIADKLKEHMIEKGVKSAVIDFGGNVVCIGEKPDGEPFKVGIQNPFLNRNEVYGIIEVKDKSVVSSGIYERFVEKDGVKYHHILDPKTGMPFENMIEQVTIISDKSVDGDGLSTSLFALGIEDGLELINGMEGVDAMFITKDDRVYKTEGFDEKYNYKDYEKK